jgi:hypothetical protein
MRSGCRVNDVGRRRSIGVVAALPTNSNRRRRWSDAGAPLGYQRHPRRPGTFETPHQRRRPGQHPGQQPAAVVSDRWQRQCSGSVVSRSPRQRPSLVPASDSVAEPAADSWRGPWTLSTDAAICRCQLRCLCVPCALCGSTLRWAARRSPMISRYTNLGVSGPQFALSDDGVLGGVGGSEIGPKLCS